MRIYISGPMTGIPGLNKEAFLRAYKELAYSKGHSVINPLELSAQFGTPGELRESFKEYYRLLDEQGEDFFARGIPVKPILERTRVARAVMDADLAAVRSCDAIYLLRGWENSRGAKKELAEACAHGLQVMQEGGAE